jgi:glycosyltransferase involved in cell wall biosynthesis
MKTALPIELNLDRVRRAPFYQRYVRPLVWAPIQVLRAYDGVRKTRFFDALAKEDRAQLHQSRQAWLTQHAKNAEPLISITTPTYNRARILVDSTLPAVLSQTYRNFEWIIVGDHCTDETADLLARVGDGRVRFANLPRRQRYPKDKRKRWRITGMDAITLAHRMARGSWIAHLDDDDVFTADHLERLLTFARAGGYEMVAGVSKLEMAPGHWEERGRMVPGQSGWPQFSHSTVLYRSYLGDCIPYDTRCLKVNVGGDGFRWQRMYNADVRVGFLQDVVTFMPLRPGEAERSIYQFD